MSEDEDERAVYGTAALDAPVSRADFERAIRMLNLSDLHARDAMLQLAARVIALTDELTRRIDGVEPVPAPPNTVATAPTATVEAAVESLLPATLMKIRAADNAGPGRVSLDLSENKYEVTPAEIPCEELIPLCGARCCQLTFALSTLDLDEGVIRWDYGHPYLIRQRKSDGFCVHNHPESHGCTVHAVRPSVCRTYDCRTDSRVWIDYEKRIPAPPIGTGSPDPGEASTMFDLVDRARARGVVIRTETIAISESFADADPQLGPALKPR